MVCLSCILIAFIILVIVFNFGSALLNPVRKYFQGGQFKKNHIRIDGKVVIITGCNTGIGKPTVMDLARRGAKIYMACRDEAKCEEARKEIIEKTGNQNVFFRELNLSSLESVRNFVAKFLKDEQRLDILINNAGVALCPKTLTQDGFESHIGVNHMGHFLLTNLLLGALKNGAPSRIVVVSSMAHKRGKINKNDLNSEKSYDSRAAYSQSKLANVLFTRQLAKKLDGTGVTVNALHPGVVETEIFRHLSPTLLWFARPIIYIMFKTPESGAQTTLHLALDPELVNVSGQYFKDCKIASTTPKDDDTAEWLWNKSAEWTGLKV